MRPLCGSYTIPNIRTILVRGIRQIPGSGLTVILIASLRIVLPCSALPGVGSGRHVGTYPGRVASCVPMGCLTTPMEFLRPTG